MTRPEVERAVAEAMEMLRQRGIRGAAVVVAAQLDDDPVGLGRVYSSVHGLRASTAALALCEGPSAKRGQTEDFVGSVAPAKAAMN